MRLDAARRYAGAGGSPGSWGHRRAGVGGWSGRGFPEDRTGRFYKRIFGGGGYSKLPEPLGFFRSFSSGKFFLFLIYNYNIYEYINITNVCENGAGWPGCWGQRERTCGQHHFLRPVPIPGPVLQSQVARSCRHQMSASHLFPKAMPSGMGRKGPPPPSSTLSKGCWVGSPPPVGGWGQRPRLCVGFASMASLSPVGSWPSRWQSGELAFGFSSQINHLTRVKF